jgi:hypothetical protein
LGTPITRLRDRLLALLGVDPVALPYVGRDLLGADTSARRAHEASRAIVVEDLQQRFLTGSASK